MPQVQWRFGSESPDVCYRAGSVIAQEASPRNTQRNCPEIDRFPTPGRVRSFHEDGGASFCAGQPQQIRPVLDQDPEDISRQSGCLLARACAADTTVGEAAPDVLAWRCPARQARPAEPVPAVVNSRVIVVPVA